MTRASSHLGHWQAFSPVDAARLFASVQVPWWIAGGWALDLFLGDSSRPHEDLDVGVLRCDAPDVLRALGSWEVFGATDGVLEPLPPRASPRDHVHSLWCRPIASAPWALELMLDEGVRAGSDPDGTWVFRRAQEVRRPLAEIVRVSPSGIPYLAPEIQLLYKAKTTRERDIVDFRRTLPRLDVGAREWLLDALLRVSPRHEWIDELRRSISEPRR